MRQRIGIGRRRRSEIVDVESDRVFYADLQASNITSVLFLIIQPHIIIIIITFFFF